MTHKTGLLMTPNEYLQGILAREAVDTSNNSPVLTAANTLAPIIQQWGNGYLAGIQASGSYAKGTANNSGTDIDIFISLHSTTPDSLSEIYNKLFSVLESEGLNPKKQNVSIGIRIKHNGRDYDVDLVPAKQQSILHDDHSLYRNKANTRTKTNVNTHINTVRQGGRISETRLMKLWRNQKNLDFPSFYLELVVIEALKGKNLSLSDGVRCILHYLANDFINLRVVDPANSANIISDDLTQQEKAAIKSAAAKSIQAQWSEFVR
jgi:hypothetical protein